MNKPMKAAKPAAKPKAAPKPKAKVVDIWEFASSPQMHEIDAAQKKTQAASAAKAAKAAAPQKAKTAASNAAINAASKKGLGRRRSNTDNLIDNF